MADLACIALKFKIAQKAVRSVLEMEDSVCSLLLLHPRSLGLLRAPKDLDVLKAVMIPDELYGNRWLLAYEANVKRWLPAARSGDHVASDANFGQLKAAGVTFYDTVQTTLPTAPGDSSELSTLLSRIVADYSETTEADRDV